MRFSTPSALFLLASSARAVDSTPTASTQPACTATSHTSGAFFDLRPDRAWPAGQGARKSTATKDYTAKGHDYGKNFTMNICGPVVDQVSDVIGMEESQWANVSAYYMARGQVYSIGSQSTELQSRGRKLVLQYTGGSPCGPDAKESKRSVEAADDTGNKEARDQKPSTGSDKSVRRKSTIISFLCDRDPIQSKVGVSFVGTDPDECAYFFEARSIHACAHAEPHKPGSVGPGSVFGLILVIAFLVYLLGGIFYNRTVVHARGWRQLPNYSLWASIWSFFCDMFAILWSACLRRMPARRGYSHLNTSPTRRRRDHEAENRLIDQLDEEWED